MGKNRGNRGGNHSNNSNNRNNDNNNKRNKDSNNNKQNKQGGKYCKSCQKKGHDITECWKSGNQNNQNNKVNKNKNNSNQNQIKTICTRCGFSGHETKNCTATTQGIEQQCPCGCDYHQPWRCPWNKDPDERDRVLSKVTGKICQWCKDDGDGTHDFSDCNEAVRFRNTLMGEIQRNYDGLHWCWHCQAENHKTKACDKPLSKVGKTKWETKIDSIIEQWVNQDMSTLTAAYLGNEDVFMSVPGKGLRAPVASDYRWCIYCQEFGHHADPSTCDTDEFYSRCPARFRNSEVTKQPYVPNAVTFNNSSSSSVATTLANYGANIIKAKCITPNCKTFHNFNAAPSNNGKLDGNFCNACRKWTPHPFASGRKDSKTEILQEIRKIVEAVNDPTAAKKRKKEPIDPYKFRPSVALPPQLAVDRWPETQPRYDDLGTIPEDSDVPLFSRHLDVFNLTGNAQSYFPPVLIRLTQQDLRIKNDDDCDINKAGRLGLVLQCNGCGAVGVVRDAEGDLVMCGTEGANTVGCGWGMREWINTAYKNQCRCPALVGKTTQPLWVYPQKH